MVKFEVKLVSCKIPKITDDLAEARIFQNMCNKFGKDGWEFMHIDPQQNPQIGLAYFKRKSIKSDKGDAILYG